jgi:SAM-dependent methyltransferase
MTVLDIGCALGGFVNVLNEHLESFKYTGVDISHSLVAHASQLHPDHRFVRVTEGDLSALGQMEFDLVICLGVMHLTPGWRTLISEAWNRTIRSFVFDLRETHESTIEDGSRSYMRMDFADSTPDSSARNIPYLIINTSEALQTITSRCIDNQALQQYGYRHPIRNSASSPIQEVMMKTYRVDRDTPLQTASQ